MKGPFLVSLVVLAGLACAANSNVAPGPDTPTDPGRDAEVRLDLPRTDAEDAPGDAEDTRPPADLPATDAASRDDSAVDLVGPDSEAIDAPPLDAGAEDAHAADARAQDPGALDTPNLDVPQDEGPADPCATCVAPRQCIDGACCTPPVASGAFQLPAHTSYVHWWFGPGRLASLEFVVRIEDDPRTQVGLYFSPVNTHVDFTPLYLGIQTNLLMPGVGFVGKGFLFSRWDSLDPADARVAPGGFTEIGTHEGEFIGVRLPYDWTAGEYILRLERKEASGDGDWFDLSVTSVATGVQTFAGGLRFPRKAPGVPGSLDPAVTTFTEVYSGVSDYSEVPAWGLRIRATGDGAPPSRATSEYPAVPYAEYPNTDVLYDSETGEVRMRFGGMTPRCTPPGRLF